MRKLCVSGFCALTHANFFVSRTKTQLGAVTSTSEINRCYVILYVFTGIEMVKILTWITGVAVLLTSAQLCLTDGE